jgi:hypothetical protein
LLPSHVDGQRDVAVDELRVGAPSDATCISGSATGVDREVGTLIRAQHIGLMRCLAGYDAKDATLEHMPHGHDHRPTVSVDHPKTHEDRLPKERQDFLFGQNARLRIDRDDFHATSSRRHVDPVREYQ